MPFLSNDLLAALPRMRRYARLLIEDPARADDLVRDTVTRARKARDDPASGAKATVQLLSMLRSVYSDQCAPGQPHGPIPPPIARHPSPIASGDSNQGTPRANAERAQDLLAQVFRLPLQQREVLALVAVEQMSYADVATVLAVPPATVFARLAQAREALRSGTTEPLAAPKGAG